MPPTGLTNPVDEDLQGNAPDPGVTCCNVPASGDFPVHGPRRSGPPRTREMAREGKNRGYEGVFLPGTGGLTVFFPCLTATII